MILGIYHPAEGLGHDASVALTDSDGKILAAQSEERFSRIKMDGGYPFRALENLQKMFPFRANDLEMIAVPYWDNAQKWRDGVLIAGNMMMKPDFGKSWLQSRLGKQRDSFLTEMKALGAYDYFESYRKQIDQKNHEENRPAPQGWRDFLRISGFEKVPLMRVDHHVAHLASAYFTSGWDQALLVSADGAGALKSSLVAVGNKGKIQVIGRTFLPNSPGRFWEIITTLCGFNHHKHGGKVTGLAASGNPQAGCYQIMKESMWAEGLTMRTRLSPARMANDLKGYSREDLAASAQRRLEEVVCSVVAEAVRQTGLRRVALAGGVFANVLLNQKIYELAGVDDIFIFPAMGDEGLSVGAALWGISRVRELKPARFSDPFLGPEYSEAEMAGVLKKHGLSYERLDDEKLIIRCVEALINHRVVACYEGRMEYGPRALGHRSILYGTEDPSVNQWLNERLHRSEFMPFAPVTLAEEAARCYWGIKNDHAPAKFMTMTYACTDWMKKKSPAVVHKDGTARPQLVTAEANGRYYKILREYFVRTGIPSLVNTSFNMHEEPIVCTPEDAVRGYLDGGLDALMLGPFWVSRVR